MSNLEHRSMDIDNRCVVCNAKGEDGGHLFFKCHQVVELWTRFGLRRTASFLGEDLTRPGGDQIHDWVKKVHSDGEETISSSDRQ
jgi:hypothetical protein